MAELIAAFPDVQVARADTGRLHLDQHLRASGLRRRLIDLLQRRIEIGDLKTLHGVTPRQFVVSGLLRSAGDGKRRTGADRRDAVPAPRWRISRPHADSGCGTGSRMVARSAMAAPRRAPSLPAPR